MDVDINGVIGLLKKDCIMCNLTLRKAAFCICKDCPFIFSSRTNKENNPNTTRTRTGCGKPFRKYGINWAMGKERLFYFLYHPELDFEWPPLPEYDTLGNHHTEKKFMWAIHHINGLYWDDSPWNLLLCLNTEHGYFEGESRREERKWNKILEGVVEWQTGQ